MSVDRMVLAFAGCVVLLGVALATAGIGWFRHRLWGWRLAAAIIATQVLGDVVNCARGDWLRGGTGAVIAGAPEATSDCLRRLGEKEIFRRVEELLEILKERTAGERKLEQ